MSKDRDRSHLRVVPTTGLPAPADNSPAQTTTFDPDRVPPSSKLVELARDLISAAIVRVNTGKCSEERFKFSCSASDKFGWIIISRIDANRVMIRSNDGQMDIGKPPSFYRTGRREEAHDFLIDVMSHLCTYMGNYVNLKILHEVDPAP